MQTTAEQEPIVVHGEIAKVAHDTWYQEGWQNGRDLEYWLRAEPQLRAHSQQWNGQHKDDVLAKRKVPSAILKASASQPVPQAGPSTSNSRKRKSMR